MKISKLLFILLVAHLNFAQVSSTTARLSKIESNGLHTIHISPEIRSFSKSDLSNLRLYDSKKQEVPYYIWQENIETSTLNFEEYPILSKIIIPNKSTVIIVENKANEALEEIILNIANSKLSKICDISGSNDRNQWFGLMDDHVLPNLENVSNTSVFLSVELPASSYKYIKIQVDDTKTAPVDFIKIGQFKSHLLLSKLLPIKPISAKTTSNLETKKTQIIVSFGNSQVLDQLEFKISAPNFFKRQARLLVKNSVTDNETQTEESYRTLLEFELNSGKINRFQLGSIFEKELIIEIDNEDNQALEISELIFSQLPIFLVSDLKANEQYTLKTGDPNLLAPNYDLDYFRTDAIESLPMVTIMELRTVNENSEKLTTNQSFWQKKWFLWLCIGIVGVAILFFTRSLLKDMKKEN